MPIRTVKLPGRNQPCLCKSGKKFKACCAPKIQAAESELRDFMGPQEERVKKAITLADAMVSGFKNRDGVVKPLPQKFVPEGYTLAPTHLEEATGTPVYDPKGLDDPKAVSVE